jgi:hypothetical protein
MNRWSGDGLRIELYTSLTNRYQGVSRLLKRLAPSLLGLFGGGLGVLSYYDLMSPSLDLSACSCGWKAAEGIVTWPLVVGSLIGLVGCAVFLFNPNAGGTFLISGGVVASSTIVFAEVATLLFGPVILHLASNLFFGLLLILTGLLAFPRTRHLIKTLHDEGWIPWQEAAPVFGYGEPE